MSPHRNKSLLILRDAFVVALFTLVALACAYQVRSRVVIDVGSAHDDFFLARFFDAEDDHTQTYRWAQGQARVELMGQQLATPWTLYMRLNGYRPNRLAQVQLDVNGTRLDQFQAEGIWDDYEIAANIANDVWSGNTTLDISSDTFVPNRVDAKNPDTRRLGIALDKIVWTPTRSATFIGNDDAWLDLGQTPIVPPLAIVLSWAGAFAVLYATARGIGLDARPVRLAFGIFIALLALGIALARPYVATFTFQFLNLALLLAVLALALMLLIPRLAAHFSIAMDARAVAGLCAIMLVSIGLKWGGAWYPQFRSSDLTFHAHRLEFVARGNLFFTSELPDAARRVVPYPPALYVTLAPLAPWVTDDEALLLIANAIFDAVAIAGIYFAARKISSLHSPISGSTFALFVAFLVAFNPVAFWIYSWGNHTNIFGQVAATLLFCILLSPSRTERTPLRSPPHILERCGERSLLVSERCGERSLLVSERCGERSLLALFFLVLASTAHLGVFLSLLAFFPIAIVLRFALRDETARRESIALAGLFLVGVALAAFLYYAEFTEPLWTQTQTFVNDFSAGRAATGGGITLKRVTDVARFTWEQLGWVLLIGGIAGIPLAWQNFPPRVRVIWVAWLVVGLLFGLVTIGSSFSTRYTLWAAPALALSAGLVLAWLAEKSRAAQFLAYALCACAFAQTLSLWLDRVLNAYQ